MESHAILRFPEVRALTGLSRSTIWRLQKKDFPKPVKLGENSVGWYKKSVEVWLRSRPSVCSAAPHPSGSSEAPEKARRPKAIRMTAREQQ